MGKLVCLWCVVAMHLAGAPSALATPPDDGLVVRRSHRTGLASFLTARDGGPIPTEPQAAPRYVKRQGSARVGHDHTAEFLRRYAPLFGVTAPDRELTRIRRRTDSIGHTHTAYKQKHKGVPVFAGLLKVHEDARGNIHAANGHVFRIGHKLNAEPTLTADEAEAIATAEIVESEPDVDTTTLVIVDPGWYGDRPIGAHLAYLVIVSDWSLPLRDALFVDAHTGEVLDRWSLIQTAKDRRIYDGHNTVALPGTPTRFEDDPPAFDDEVNQAYDYLGDAYDYFSRAFDRDSLDDAGLSLVATVNSQATGLSCPNAQWRGDSLQMLLCQSLVVDDVVGHELMHGITQFTANLIYQNQPGQLNESYSDIFGEMIDLFNGDAAWAGPPGGTPWPTDLDYGYGGIDTPNSLRTGSCLDSTVRWLIGEDWQVIRDMWNPRCQGQPDRAFSTLQTCGGPSGFDNGGVHSGSGIPNHAFAIMTDGKSFNGFDVTGIGPIKAAAVWYRALAVYLTPASDFNDAYNALNRAALDLIGTAPNDPRTGAPSDSIFTLDDAAEVDKALIAVEMNTEGRCGAVVAILDPAAPQQCPARVTVFQADFEDGTDGWTTSITVGDPPTPYQWVLEGDLPVGRSGTAFFCEDPNLGDCTPASDESAVHTLASPVIEVPDGMDNLRLTFTHYIATESGWDGGNLQISVDGGGWRSVPEAAFLHNPYNMTLHSMIEGNSNPLQDQRAYSGAGGEWGTTLIDLSAFVAMQTIQVRFNLGKDGCTGVDGWYVDDVEVYHCAECPEGDVQWFEPQDGLIDARQARSLEDGLLQGVDRIVALGPPDAEPGCWSLCETATEGTANFVVGSAEITSGTYTLELDRPLTPGALTKITYTSGAGVVTMGTFTSLPGDSNGDGVSDTADITALVDCYLEGTCPAPPEAHRCDLDRSGRVAAEDLLRLIDLLSGAGRTSRSWNLESPHDDNECQ